MMRLLFAAGSESTQCLLSATTACMRKKKQVVKNTVEQKQLTAHVSSKLRMVSDTTSPQQTHLIYSLLRLFEVIER